MTAQTTRRRPNILLITSDQQRADCYGFEGRKVKTPHLDLMARQGTRFSACITPNVVCQPSRASMLTGMLPSTHGVSDNGIDLPAEVGEGGFGGVLAHAGYATGMIGKAHFATYMTFAPTGSPECVESSRDFPPTWRGPYMGFGEVDMMLLGHNYWLPYKAPRGLHYEHWYHSDGLGDEKNRMYAGYAPHTPTPQTFHSQLPEAWHNSTWVGNKTIDFMREHKDAPFCVWASFPDPHHPFDAPEPWSRLHHPDEVDLPPERRRDLDRRPWWHRASIETTPKLSGALLKMRSEYSRIPELSDAQLRELTANYYGMISLIDHNVGRIMTELNGLGLADDTIVIYTTDHGDWLGDHGLILKGPMLYEGLLRVGMIVRGPGVKAGQVVDQPVSTLDLSPTFFELAGVAPQLVQHGQSLRALLAGEDAPRDCARSEWELLPGRVGVGLSLRCVRTRDAKLTLELKTGAGELYDLKADPHEMNNVFDAPAYAELRDQLTALIHARPDDAGPLRVAIGSA
jgi:arylsulfatase A-like enzyme